MKKIVGVVLILSLLLVLGGCQQAETEEEEFRVAVTTVPVERGSLTISDRLTGTVKASKEITIIPSLPVEVVRVAVSAGTRVLEGDVLVELDADNIAKQVEQARANYNAASLQLATAKDNYERTARLYEQGAVSEQQYDASKSQYELSRDGSYEQARVALEMASDSLDQAVITAPMDGVIGYVHAQEGQMANPSAPIVSVLDLSQMEAGFGLSEKQINQVQVGETIEVYFPSVQEEPFMGVITEASPQADAMTQSFPIKVIIDNDQELIKSGMTCSISLVQQMEDNILLVPEDAIRYTSQSNIIFLLVGDRVRLVEVEVILTDGNQTAITGDLEEGESVIVLGKERLNDGSLVRIIEEEIVK